SAAFRRRTFDADILPEPMKSLKRLTHRNGIALGQQGPSFIHNSRRLLFGDDPLVDELPNQGNEQGCVCICPFGGTENEHEGHLFCCRTRTPEPASNPPRPRVLPPEACGKFVKKMALTAKKYHSPPLSIRR